MKIEIHIIQNFAPSNLNRDDTNTPKTCTFGNVTRARLSSQCFKKAVRDYFRDNSLTETGKRTKRIKKDLTERLQATYTNPDVLSAVLNVFIEACYSGRDAKREDETSVLLYVGEAELVEAALCVKENYDALLKNAEDRLAWSQLSDAEKKKKKEPALWKSNDVEKRLKSARLSADIALFGRMLAENPDRNVDAACQVAHAISTHQINLESDFYTAVDDLNTEEQTGAGMLGVTGYSSACYYRYALVDWNQLLRNLNGDSQLAEEALEAFLNAFVQAIPKGKQNSMAAQNRPSLGMFVVRKAGVPCSLANAFVRPVNSRQDVIGTRADSTKIDIIEASKQELARYFGRMDRVYELYKDATCTLFHDGMDAPKELAEYDSGAVSGAIEKAMQAVRSGAQA